MMKFLTLVLKRRTNIYLYLKNVLGEKGLYMIFDVDERVCLTE